MALFESDFLFDDEDAQEKEASLPESGLSATEALRKRLLEREAESESEAKRLRSELQQLREAKLKLLEAPSRSDMLMGLAQKLAAPRSKDDPRFYERKNLGTFLRDVGEFGQEEKQAEFERQKQINLLKEKYATEDLTAAEASRTRAQQLAAQYLSDEPKAATSRDTRTQDQKEAADMGMTLKEYLEFKAGLGKKSEKAGPGGEAEQILWATETMASSTATAAQKDAARRILEKKEPRDVRADRIKKEKYADSYLGRIKDQNEFTIPDIQSAIDQIDEGGIFVAGNIAKIIRGVPIIGQAATDLEKTMESIQAKVGFDKMLQLKETSPTGSTGLGAVSNAEQRLLQSVKGSLDKDQRPENLRRNLIRLKNFYEKDAFEILNRETGIQGLSGIDETLSSLRSETSEAASSSKKKRTIKLPSGRTVEVED
jgi:hypothetical protein